MPTRPTHAPPQTSKQARAEYLKYGPRISSQEQRQLDRGAELFVRAEKIRDAEKRRQVAKKKRADREVRDREARSRMGIASQKPKVAMSQCLLEGFLKVVKAGDKAVAKDMVKDPGSPAGSEPWSDDEIDDGALMGAFALEHEDPAESRKRSELGQQQGDEQKHDSKSQDGVRCVVDGWEDFFSTSNTQIDREISASRSVSHPPPAIDEAETDFGLSEMSTQDISFSADDLKELGVSSRSTRAPSGHSLGENEKAIERRKLIDERSLMPPPLLPSKKPAARPQPALVPHYTDFDFNLGLSTQDLRQVAV